MKSKKIMDKDMREAFVTVDKLCQQVHLKGRTRINKQTAINWIRVLKIRRTRFLCLDGKFRAAIKKQDAVHFLIEYRRHLSFKVVG